RVIRPRGALTHCDGAEVDRCRGELNGRADARKCRSLRAGRVAVLYAHSALLESHQGWLELQINHAIAIVGDLQVIRTGGFLVDDKAGGDRKRRIAQGQRASGVVSQRDGLHGTENAYRRNREVDRGRSKHHVAGTRSAHPRQLRTAGVTVIDDQGALLEASGLWLEGKADGAVL